MKETSLSWAVAGALLVAPAAARAQTWENIAGEFAGDIGGVQWIIPFDLVVHPSERVREQVYVVAGGALFYKEGVVPHDATSTSTQWYPIASDPWISLGAPPGVTFSPVSVPAAVHNYVGRVSTSSVFMLGSDGAIWWRRETVNGSNPPGVPSYAPWESLGGMFIAGDPAVTSDGGSRIFVSVRTTDGSVFYKQLDLTTNTWWPGQLDWRLHNGVTMPAPGNAVDRTAISFDGTHVTIYAIDSAGTLRGANYVASSPDVRSDWSAVPIGGPLAAAPVAVVGRRGTGIVTHIVGVGPGDSARRPILHAYFQGGWQTTMTTNGFTHPSVVRVGATTVNYPCGGAPGEHCHTLDVAALGDNGALWVATSYFEPVFRPWVWSGTGHGGFAGVPLILNHGLDTMAPTSARRDVFARSSTVSANAMGLHTTCRATTGGWLGCTP